MVSHYACYCKHACRGRPPSLPSGLHHVRLKDVGQIEESPDPRGQRAPIKGSAVQERHGLANSDRAAGEVSNGEFPVPEDHLTLRST